MMMTLVKTRKSPYYQAKIRLSRGTPIIWKSTGEKNKVLATKQLERIIEELRGNPGLASRRARITIKEFCRIPQAEDTGGEYWQYVSANRAATTCDRVRDILRTQIIPTFGAYQFEAVQPLTIEKWKQQRQKEVEKATVKKELDIFSNVFRIARKIFRYTRYNPLEDIERPTVPKKKTRVPSAVEIQRFFETAVHHRPEYFAPLLTMYITGARIDEVRHLEPGDVLPSENKLAYHVKDGWSPKDAQDRDAPLVEPLKSVLMQVLTRHAGGKWLFMRSDGRTLYCKRCRSRVAHLGNMKKMMRTIARLAGISQRITHHLFRHCSNTHAQQLGAKQQAAMELLGQQTTEVNRLYLHVDWDEVVETAQRLGQSVGHHLVGLSVGVPQTEPSSDVTLQKISVPR